MTRTRTTDSRTTPAAPGGVADWNGEQKTGAIIQHANRIINDYLLSDANGSVNLCWTDDDGVEHQFAGFPATVGELSDALEILKKANNNLDKYMQFLYPAAYGCYLYEPEVREGEPLDPQYAPTNWYLPAAGELMRMYSYHARSRTGGIGETESVGANTLPDRSVVDRIILDALASDDPNVIKTSVLPSHVESGSYTESELAAINRYLHSLPDAEKPIYSMILWRTLVAYGSIPFASHVTGSHWSSTEATKDFIRYMSFGNGDASHGYTWFHGRQCAYTVRPAVAYRFML